MKLFLFVNYTIFDFAKYIRILLLSLIFSLYIIEKTLI